MTAAPSFRFGVVCESPKDQETACAIADRALQESPECDWLDRSTIDRIRAWVGVQPGTDCLLWKHVPAEAARLGIKAHGHLEGKPGEPDAAAARRALRLFLTLTRTPDAVLLIRDSDGIEARRSGLEQARQASTLNGRTVIGVANTKRECWVLSGFTADGAAEEVLAELRTELGFCPCSSSQRLTARHDHDKLSAKRVLRKLTDGDEERERSCWRDAPLSLLRQRGEHNGLREYLDELKERLVPIVGGNRRQGRG